MYTVERFRTATVATLCSAALLLAAVESARAEPIAVSGKVVDDETGKPIQNLMIQAGTHRSQGSQEDYLGLQRAAYFFQERSIPDHRQMVRWVGRHESLSTAICPSRSSASHRLKEPRSWIW